MSANIFTKFKTLSKLLVSIPVLCGLNSYAFATPELENIRFVSDNIIQINTNETLKKIPDSFILNDTNPSKIIFDFADVDFKKELKQKLLENNKNIQIVKDDNTNKTRLVITLKQNQKVNYKTELYRNGIQITLSPITEHNKNFDANQKTQTQARAQTQTQIQNQNSNDKVADEVKINHFDHIVYSKTNNVINFNFLESNVEIDSYKDDKNDYLVIQLLDTTLSKKAKDRLKKNIATYNKNNSFNIQFLGEQSGNLKFVVKHNNDENKNKNFKNWDYNLSQTNKMLTLQLLENYYDDNDSNTDNNNTKNSAQDTKKNKQNLVENNAIDDQTFCEQMLTVNQSAGNIVLTHLNASDINDFVLENKCQENNSKPTTAKNKTKTKTKNTKHKKIDNTNIVTNVNNNVVLIGNSNANLLENLAKKYHNEPAEMPTISNEFIPKNSIKTNENITTVNLSNAEEIIPLTLDFLVLQKNSKNELVVMPKTTTKHNYQNDEETLLNNTTLDFKNTKLFVEVIPKIISKNKTNLSITLRQNSSANTNNNINNTEIITKTDAYVDNNGTLSIAILSPKNQQKILVLIQPKINNK